MVKNQQKQEVVNKAEYKLAVYKTLYMELIVNTLYLELIMTLYLELGTK